LYHIQNGRAKIRDSMVQDLSRERLEELLHGEMRID